MDGRAGTIPAEFGKQDLLIIRMLGSTHMYTEHSCPDAGV
jgi:hypothetical protein